MMWAHMRVCVVRRVIYNADEPLWNEEFVFIVSDSSSMLNADVMYKDVFKDEYVGGVTIRSVQCLLPPHRMELCYSHMTCMDKSCA